MNRENYFNNLIFSKDGIQTRANRVVVAVGSSRRLKRGKRAKMHTVSFIRVHPNYYYGEEYNIAVLYLAEVINMHIQGCKIARVSLQVPQPGDTVYTLGWGQLYPVTIYNL